MMKANTATTPNGAEKSEDGDENGIVADVLVSAKGITSPQPKVAAVSPRRKERLLRKGASTEDRGVPVKETEVVADGDIQTDESSITTADPFAASQSSSCFMGIQSMVRQAIEESKTPGQSDVVAAEDMAKGVVTNGMDAAEENALMRGDSSERIIATTSAPRGNKVSAVTGKRKPHTPVVTPKKASGKPQKSDASADKQRKTPDTKSQTPAPVPKAIGNSRASKSTPVPEAPVVKQPIEKPDEATSNPQQRKKFVRAPSVTKNPSNCGKDETQSTAKARNEKMEDVQSRRHSVRVQSRSPKRPVVSIRSDKTRRENQNANKGKNSVKNSGSGKRDMEKVAKKSDTLTGRSNGVSEKPEKSDSLIDILDDYFALPKRGGNVEEISDVQVEEQLDAPLKFEVDSTNPKEAQSVIAGKTQSAPDHGTQELPSASKTKISIDRKQEANTSKDVPALHTAEKCLPGEHQEKTITTALPPRRNKAKDGYNVPQPVLSEASVKLIALRGVWKPDARLIDEDKRETNCQRYIRAQTADDDVD
ncbi:unnamed protein product [Amoebophrya sp. A25]|nr:unnamed protein product [Amoebophrya sp. A25]|eukprot:GSA25T00020043001.1